MEHSEVVVHSIRLRAQELHDYMRGMVDSIGLENYNLREANAYLSDVPKALKEITDDEIAYNQIDFFFNTELTMAYRHLFDTTNDYVLFIKYCIYVRAVGLIKYSPQLHIHSSSVYGESIKELKDLIASLGEGPVETINKNVVNTLDSAKNIRKFFSDLPENPLDKQFETFFNCCSALKLTPVTVNNAVPYAYLIVTLIPMCIAYSGTYKYDVKLLEELELVCKALAPIFHFIERTLLRFDVSNPEVHALNFKDKVSADPLS